MGWGAAWDALRSRPGGLDRHHVEQVSLSSSFGASRDDADIINSNVEATLAIILLLRCEYVFVNTKYQRVMGTDRLA